jgi:hypothetical protein
LHSAVGYITPADYLAGLSEVMVQERDRKPTRLANRIKRNELRRNKLPSGVEAITTKVASRRIRLCRGAT